MLDSILLVLILRCEIAFLAVLFLGWFAHGIHGCQEVNLYCSGSNLLINVSLFIIAVVGFKCGTTATFFHGLAAAYIGLSICCKHKLVHWLDAKLAVCGSIVKRKFSLFSQVFLAHMSDVISVCKKVLGNIGGVNNMSLFFVR